MIEKEPKKETAVEFNPENGEEQISEIARKFNKDSSSWMELEEFARLP